jgi:RimJ/RimL family protein N-acetyltransferase
MTEAAATLIAWIFAIGTDDIIYSGAFAENAASLRVQEKLGFTVDGKTSLYSRPRGANFPHLNTALVRSYFRQFSS